MGPGRFRIWKDYITDSNGKLDYAQMEPNPIVYYLSENFKAQKERYEQYVAQMLTLAGWKDAEREAAAVVRLESKMAEAQWTRAEGRDAEKTYNPMSFDELTKYAPEFHAYSAGNVLSIGSR